MITYLKLTAIVILICLLYGFIAVEFIGVQTGGLFGDSFGALNTLFSGLALIGMVIAIHHQQEELKLTRLELSKQSNELALSNAAASKNKQLQSMSMILSALMETIKMQQIATNPNFTFNGIMAINTILSNNENKLTDVTKYDQNDFKARYTSLSLGHLGQSLKCAILELDNTDSEIQRLGSSMINSIYGNTASPLIILTAQADNDKHYIALAESLKIYNASDLPDNYKRLPILQS